MDDDDDDAEYDDDDDDDACDASDEEDDAVVDDHGDDGEDGHDADDDGMAKQSPLSEAAAAHKSQRRMLFHLSGDCFTYHIGEGRGWLGLCGDGAADRSGDGAVILAVSCSLQTHASGVLGFSFACGRRPNARLSPRTERSYLKSLVLCRHMQAES